MDRTDKLINNREPRRMLLMFAVILLLFAGAWYLLSGVIADAAMQERINGALAFSAGQRFTDVPDEDCIAHGAELVFNRTKAIAECRDCGAKTHLIRFRFRCDSCGSQKLTIVSGREFQVDSVDIEDQ